MKNTSLFATAVFLLAFAAQAQEAESTSTVKTVPQEVKIDLLKGLKVGLLFSQLKASYNDDGDRSEQGIGPAYGLSAGYAYFERHALGVSANLGLIQLKDRELKSYRGRADASVIYSFNDYFHVKAGLNFVAPVAPIVERSEFSVGYQSGIGYRFDKTWSAELNVVQMRINYSSDTDAHSAVVYTGTEIAAIATF